MGGAARPGAGGRIGDRVKLHRHRVRLDGREYTLITPRPGTGVRFSTNRYHGTWHILSDLRGARLLARLLWGLAYQRVPGTLALIGPPFLDPNPFDAEPADPIALVAAQLTGLRAQAARDLRRRLPLGAPDGTVRWQTPGLEHALAACRRWQRDPPAQWRLPWCPPQGPRTRMDRIGGMLVVMGEARELKTWAVATGRLGDGLRDGTDSTRLDNEYTGEVLVFTDYRRRVSAARAARREVLARPDGPRTPAEQRPLIWQHGAEILACRDRMIVRGG
ncbi:MAG TPA: hypothetical protein VF482_22950 [Trebonia sp.]